MAVYPAVFRHLLLPAYERLKGGPRLTAYLPEYERQQWLPKEQLSELQLRKLNALLAHAWRTVPFLQRFWQAAGVDPAPLERAEDLARYPVLTKRHLREHFDDLVSTEWRTRLLTKTTGGSTGTPLRLGFSRDNEARRLAVMWRGYGWSGARLGGRGFYLWGAPLKPAPLKERLYHAAYNRTFVNSFTLRHDNVHEVAERLNDVRPEYVVGYVTPLLMLARWALDNGRPLYRPGAVLTAAEALFRPQRELLEQAFGTRITNTYGCREVMLIAAQCEQGSLHWNADHLVVETVGADDRPVHGEPGRVLLTDLHNYALPLIRYANDDVAVHGSGTCACGRTLPLLDRVEGRTLDAIRTADGRVVPGEFFPYVLKDLLYVREYQVVQEALDRVTVAVVPARPLTDDDRNEIRSGLARALGDAVTIAIDEVPRIERTATGKLRMTVSRLDAVHG